MEEDITTTMQKINYIINNSERMELISESPQEEIICGYLTQMPYIQGKFKKCLNTEGQLFIQCLVEGVLRPSNTIEGQLQDTNTLLYGVMDVLPQQQQQSQYDIYSGSVEVIPTFSEQILYTKAKRMKDNIKVFQIPTYETSNDSGITFII